VTPRLLPRSLRGRLTLVIMLAAVLVAGVGLVLLYTVLDAQLRGAVDDGLQGRLDDVVAEARTGQGSVLDDPYAQVVNDRGEVTAASPAAPEEAVLTTVERASAGDGVVFGQRQVPGLPGVARLAAETVPGTDSTAVVGASLSGVEAANDRLALVLGLALPAVVLLLAVIVRWAVGAALRPVGALSEQAARISSAGTADRLPVPTGDDEIVELARTLNGMLDRLRSSFERERAFVDDASHELRTPIAVLRGELELALLDGDPQQLRRAVEIAQAEAEHLSNLAVDLLVLARQRAGVLELDRRHADLCALAERTATRLRPLVDASISVEGHHVNADVDVVRVQQLLTNLATNAVEAGAEHVRIIVAEQGANAVLDVADDGPGFPDELVATAFHRFTRADRARTRPGAKTAGTGAGLGLPIAAAIVRAHGGDISIRNNAAEGAWVRVELPMSRPRPPAS
jgi:two-component system, OmpR family, sensor kinase